METYQVYQVSGMIMYIGYWMILVAGAWWRTYLIPGTVENISGTVTKVRNNGPIVIGLDIAYHFG